MVAVGKCITVLGGEPGTNMHVDSERRNELAMGYMLDTTKIKSLVYAGPPGVVVT